MVQQDEATQKEKRINISVPPDRVSPTLVLSDSNLPHAQSNHKQLLSQKGPRSRFRLPSKNTCQVETQRTSNDEYTVDLIIKQFGTGQNEVSCPIVQMCFQRSALSKHQNKIPNISSSATGVVNSSSKGNNDIVRPVVATDKIRNPYNRSRLRDTTVISATLPSHQLGSQVCHPASAAVMTTSTTPQSRKPSMFGASLLDKSIKQSLNFPPQPAILSSDKIVNSLHVADSDLKPCQHHP